MATTHTIVAHFPSHTEAETVVRELQHQGFDMQKLSIIGKDYQTSEQVRGFLSWQDTSKAGATGGVYWGTFFGGLFGILVGAGVIFIPGMAPLVIAGPITGVLAGWLEGTLVGATGAAAIGGLAGALGGLGIPKDEVLKYETKIQAGEFIILVTGTTEDVTQAKQMLDKISHGISMSVAAQEMEPNTITLFAPTDEAFSKLPSGTMGFFLDNPPELEKLLTYHIIAQRLLASELYAADSDPRVEGSMLTIYLDRSN